MTRSVPHGIPANKDGIGLCAGVPDDLSGLRKITFFWLRTFRIIRPLGDPRIHFALNCMVVGCPRLQRMAFKADKLEKQLDAAARTFIGESRNVRIDRGKREVWLSAIFKFYTEDFVAHEPSLIAYVNRYRADKIPADFKVGFQDYDWTVNDRKAAGE